MSEKLAEYRKQQELTAKLLQAAKDEVIAKLVEGLQSITKVIKGLKELAPDYEVAKLSDFDNLLIASGIRVSNLHSELTYDSVLHFVGDDEKPTKDFVAKFGWFATAYLKAMKTKKLLTMRKDGVKKLWKRSSNVKKGNAPKNKRKAVFKLSDEKAKEYLDFIGKSEKSIADIKKHFKTANPSNALTYLKEQGKIKVGRQEGLKKFWVKA